MHNMINGVSSKLCYVNAFHQFRSNANLFEYATRFVTGMPWDFLQVRMLYDE